ncbi:MAG: LysM peptidoglycan-binding domain-containing protein [Candidatus Eremiobacteraeota bacterium]|nr:LysM peptidoglycan-binding domain-containing protein [Candidatus Eremiobacteraeota bacterium]
MEPDIEREPGEESEQDRPSKDDILRGKFIERNFEKILKLLKKPERRDPALYVIIGLLALILVLQLLRPAGAGKGSLGDESRDEVIKRLEAIQTKVERLEKEFIVLSGGEGDTAEPSPAASSSQSSQGEPHQAAAPPSQEPQVTPKGIRKYTVKSGDTLEVICARFYRSKDPALIKALGKYNNLKGPNFDLYPGNTIKVPPRPVLSKKAK